ncbi:MAG: phosphoglycerate kinase [Bacteroidia bacterium]|nr:MAG: phosphoglycerate kinase [Bacteroidia bacterium]
MKNIQNAELQNKRVFVRVDFNVPLNEQLQVTDDRRIRAAVPTIQTLTQKGAIVILASHLGRPKKGYEEKYSLKPIVPVLSRLLNQTVHFAKDCIGDETYQQIQSLKSGEVILLENLRFYPEEEKGDLVFSKKLASLAEVYVNDAFGTAHRAHASTAVIAQFFTEKYAGFLLEAEVLNANKVLNNIQKPYTAIIGGAKVSDKILIIQNLISKVDNLLIGGGMAFTFLKALGYNIGKSLCEEDRIEAAKEIIQKAKELKVNILLPLDVVTAKEFKNDTEFLTVDIEKIPSESMGLDIGARTIEAYSKVVLESQTILWNGPMGVFEMDNFAKGTLAIAQAVAKATQEKKAYSLIGGGDSAAAIEKAQLVEKVSYVSTGGGALLEYLEGKQLPGIVSLE